MSDSIIINIEFGSFSETQTFPKHFKPDINAILIYCGSLIKYFGIDSCLCSNLRTNLKYDWYSKINFHNIGLLEIMMCFSFEFD